MRPIRRRRLALAAPLICLAIPLALPGGAGSQVTNMILDVDGLLTIEGSSGNDDITLKHVRGVADPSQTFVEVHDPAGIDVVPSNPRGGAPVCFRKDANTIHCLDLLVSAVTLDLRAGDDRVRNGLGDFVDVVEVEPTVVDGGDGDDELEGGEGKDELEGGEGDDQLDGGEATAEVLGARAGGAGPVDDRLVGGPGDDKLSGQTGNDKLFGGPGRDSLNGGQGNDRMFGGPGRDLVFGGPGQDFGRGGGADDRGAGGPGKDNFRD